MKNTFNRRLILAALFDEIDGTPPPHSASSVYYSLENAFNYKWDFEPYSLMKTLPTRRQVHRTLADLRADGLIVGTRVKVEGYSGQLPYWRVEYQLCGEVYKNSLIAKCNSLHGKIKKAKFGMNFFDSIFEMGLPADDVKPLMLEVKTLMQETHPDKATGYEEQFLQMKQCAEWLRSGIPLPTPAHGATASQLSGTRQAIKQETHNG